MHATNAIRLAILAAAACALGAGCETSKSASVREGGTVVAEHAFPTGERATSTILVRQTSPRRTQAGKECTYTIDVTNLTDADLREVTVNLEDMTNVRFVGSAPDPIKGLNGDTAWLIDELPARATKTITVRARPLAAGRASNCLSANYAHMLCASSDVVEPALLVTKTATPEVCGQCEDIKLTYVVRNTGTGTVEGVVVSDALPSGIETKDGAARVELDAGDVEPGKERTFTVAAKARHGGTYASSAVASSATGVTARSEEATTVVRQPMLAFSCDANNRMFLGRDLGYRITVRNVGGCDADESTVTASVPEGCRYLSSEPSAAFQNGTVKWDLRTMKPGQSRTMTMTIEPSAVGDARVRASAAARCAATVNTECTTQVVGIPAILLEVVDGTDPVEVGSQTTFTVTVTNQGSTPDTNVRVNATLPDQLQFVSASGTTTVTASGHALAFAPVASLAPGARAEWKVIARAKGAADARSRWEMTSEQFRAPVIETESTNLYE